MKYFTIFVVLVGLAFPVFAQNTALTERLNALNDAMTSSITQATETLADFDSQIKEKGVANVYKLYLNKFNFLMDSLQESENRFDLMVRTNERNKYIEDERDHYESIIKQLQFEKSTFDTYLKSR